MKTDFNVTDYSDILENFELPTLWPEFGERILSLNPCYIISWKRREIFEWISPLYTNGFEIKCLRNLDTFDHRGYLHIAYLKQITIHYRKKSFMLSKAVFIC